MSDFKVGETIVVWEDNPKECSYALYQNHTEGGKVRATHHTDVRARTLWSNARKMTVDEINQILDIYKRL